jgi:hypothetical protein
MKLECELTLRASRRKKRQSLGPLRSQAPKSRSTAALAESVWENDGPSHPMGMNPEGGEGPREASDSRTLEANALRSRALHSSAKSRYHLAAVMARPVATMSMGSISGSPTVHKLAKIALLKPWLGRWIRPCNATSPIREALRPKGKNWATWWTTGAAKHFSSKCPDHGERPRSAISRQRSLYLPS